MDSLIAYISSNPAFKTLEIADSKCDESYYRSNIVQCSSRSTVRPIARNQFTKSNVVSPIGYNRIKLAFEYLEMHISFETRVPIFSLKA